MFAGAPSLRHFLDVVARANGAVRVSARALIKLVVDAALRVLSIRIILLVLTLRLEWMVHVFWKGLAVRVNGPVA